MVVHYTIFQYHLCDGRVKNAQVTRNINTVTCLRCLKFIIKNTKKYEFNTNENRNLAKKTFDGIIKQNRYKKEFEKLINE